MIDNNVEQVRELLKQRMEAGFIKYGVTTERTDLSTKDWLQHLQEELLDAAVYIQTLKGKLDELERLPEIHKNNSNLSKGSGFEVPYPRALLGDW